MSAEMKLQSLQEAVEYLTERFQEEKDANVRQRLQLELNEAREKLQTTRVLLG